MNANIFIYPVLSIPLIIFLCSVIITAIKQHDVRHMGWQFVSVAVLSIFLFVYILFDTGEIFKYIVKATGDSYYISPAVIEEMLVENIDEVGQAMSRVYEKYYIIETFDVSEESDKVKYGIDDNGKIYFKVKLKHRPVTNTMQEFYSTGFRTINGTPPCEVGDDLFYKISAPAFPNMEEFKNYMKQIKLKAEIRYFRKS